MAYETGTASDAQDFIDKLIAFITTDTDLVSASQEWSEVWSTEDENGFDEEHVFEGPGLAGTDEVTVGISLLTDSDNDIYELRIRGMSGYVASAEVITDHINVSEDVTLFLDANPMTYWFTANGRRISIAVKISTVYQSAYMGLFLPFALPTSYGYPMFIGASAMGTGRDSAAPTFTDWRFEGSAFQDYMHSRHDDVPGSGLDVTGSAYLLTPEASWIQIISQISSTEYPTNWGYMHPFSDAGNAEDSTTADQNFRPWRVLEFLNPAFGGDEILIPLTLGSITPTEQLYGVLDGVYAVGGNSQVSENIIEIGADDYLVVQNAFRTGGDQYHAMKLE